MTSTQFSIKTSQIQRIQVPHHDGFFNMYFFVRASQETSSYLCMYTSAINLQMASNVKI